MAKPYQEGRSWSIRLRVKGQDIYRTGFASEAQARREAERLKQKVTEAGKPKYQGPWRTTLGQALQYYARERLPWLKGARQDAGRINRYLRASGLDVAKVTPVVGSMADSSPSEGQAILRWQVTFEPANQPRRIPRSLQGHRHGQANHTAESDRLRRLLAQTPMSQVSPYQIQELVDAMGRENYKPASIALERALLRGLFSYARTIWCWAEPVRNPATKLKLPAVDNARDRVLTNQEWKRLCETLPQSGNAYAAPAIALLLETAMRVSEPLLHATWDAVDWERCLLKLRDAKAGPRDVPLTPAAMETLRVLWRMREEAQSRRSGKSRKSRADDPRILPLTYEALKAAWRRACEAAGVEDANIHDLRHTAATRFTLEMNGNLPVLKVITGHKTISQLTRYINVKPEDVARLMHGRPLTEDNAPAGMRVPTVQPVNVPSSPATWPPGSLPSNVVPLRRAG